jgi:uncharacterized protein (TIGR02186 family)
MYVKYTLRPAIFLLILAGCMIFIFSRPASAELTTQVSPQNIAIKLLYHGTRLNIKGQSNTNDDLIIKVSSDPIDAHMKFKGKAAGLFWMKMGDITFEQVPAVYMLATSRDLDSLLQKEQQVNKGIGFESIKAGTKVETSVPGMDPTRWIDEFIKFKKSEKLYTLKEGAIIQHQGAQGNEYQLDLDWPYQAGPGTYNIEVLAVHDGKVVDKTTTSLEVARAGIVATLSNLAFNQPAVYGIIAIIVAMAAGFAVGALFKKGGGAH